VESSFITLPNAVLTSARLPSLATHRFRSTARPIECAEYFATALALSALAAPAAALAGSGRSC
jgi:hypothetical protein